MNTSIEDLLRETKPISIAEIHFGREIAMMKIKEMRTGIQQTYKYICSLLVILILLLPILLVPTTGYSQSEKAISKKNLLDSLINCKERRNCTDCDQCRLLAADFIRQIKRLKVNFQPTDIDVQEIREAGEFLGNEGLNNLIEAVRTNTVIFPYKGAAVTKQLADSIREFSAHHPAQSADAKTKETLLELVKILSDLAAEKYSLSTGLKRYLNMPLLRGETTDLIRRNLLNLDRVLLKIKTILEVMQTIDPNWSAKNLDLSTIMNRIIYEKMDFIIGAGDFLNRDVLSEDQIRMFAEEFHKEGEILNKLAKDLVGSTH